jgi:hypothetical protein
VSLECCTGAEPGAYCSSGARTVCLPLVVGVAITNGNCSNQLLN